ncbi:MAG TPA: cache domain-containing protein [Candidatus Competibacteraceae bacterium]|nr:MAG: calcium:proton antiporter [Candidatus Competibacteraceae bacterium]HOB61279.1 cache domain-containing protein [Candidatus Competibacteraceae bacterium]HQA24596.1 cache domain-containing protein [Candidatus Competibacteraceae bacterium]HQD55634.1 cache domain-containing protein [Candidatus Competibacteraceae bacterium]
MRKQRLGLAGLALLLSAAPALAADPNTATATATATPEEVVSKVHEASQYLHDKGLAGFSDFNNNKDARWVWKDSYVFVFSCRDDVMIAHPLRPDLVGKPILQMRDDKDHQLFKDMCKAGTGQSGGWVEYWWPKPGEAKASRKISFVQSANVSFKPDVLVGAGIYDDKMTVDELNKLAQQTKQPQKDAP